jgi:hypothetical protein
MQKVLRGSDRTPLAKATTVEVSMPPDRKAATGTSDVIV